MHKKGGPKKSLRPRHYIYDVIKNTNCEKQPHIDIILTRFVDGLGNAGDKVTVPQNYGYINLLLPGWAVYATPENLEKYKDYVHNTDVVKYSSPQAKIVRFMFISNIILYVFIRLQ